jgi:hypothetical protein
MRNNSIVADGDNLKNYEAEDTINTLSRIALRSRVLSMDVGFFPSGDPTRPLARDTVNPTHYGGTPPPQPRGIGAGAPALSERARGKRLHVQSNEGGSSSNQAQPLVIADDSDESSSESDQDIVGNSGDESQDGE